MNTEILTNNNKGQVDPYSPIFLSGAFNHDVPHDELMFQMMARQLQQLFAKLKH
jgi:hypothetical protein